MARPRKPTHLKLVTGTLRKTRANPDEPKLPHGLPPRPRDLSPSERAAWDRFGATLTKMRVCTPEDFAALELLACTYAEVQDLTAYLRKNGWTYQTVSTEVPGGFMVRPHPEAALLRAARRFLLVMLGRFGLTPSDRPGVNAGPDPHSGDPDDEFKSK